MTQPITIFRGISSLNTVADPARIPINKSGINDVAEAVNITIDQYGRPSRRKGFRLLMEGDFHSIFRDNGDCFAVQNHPEYGGAAIYRVTKTAPGVYAISGIRSGLTPGARMSWFQYGDRTFYANGFEKGYIEDGMSNPWVVGEYHGPDTNISFVVPDGILHMAEHSGRMFASVGTVLMWSEPGRFDLFDPKTYISFHTKIRMIRKVAGGLYIGTEKNTYFLTGSEPDEFTLTKIASFFPVEWSDSTEMVEGLETGMNEPGLCAVWTSREGVIMGSPGGAIVNRNKNKVIYPENVSEGFGCMVGYHYVHGMR